MELSKRALTAKDKGRKGGLTTARKATQAFLEARAIKAGTSTRDKYGIGYYRYIQSLRPPNKKPSEKIIRTIIPDTVPLPDNSLQLITEATKLLV
jgi:hypothetical protein